MAGVLSAVLGCCDCEVMMMPENLVRGPYGKSEYVAGERGPIRMEAETASSQTWYGSGVIDFVFRRSDNDMVFKIDRLNLGGQNIRKGYTTVFSGTYDFPRADVVLVGEATARLLHSGAGEVASSGPMRFTVEAEKLNSTDVVDSLPTPSGPDYMWMQGFEHPSAVSEGAFVELAFDIRNSNYSPDAIRGGRELAESMGGDVLKEGDPDLWQAVVDTAAIEDDRLEIKLRDFVQVFLRVTVENLVGERIYRVIYRGPEEDVIWGHTETMFLDFTLEPDIPPGKMVFTWAVKGVPTDHNGRGERNIGWTTTIPDPVQELNELMLATFNKTVDKFKENPLTAGLHDIARAVPQAVGYFLTDPWTKSWFGINYKGEPEEANALDYASMAIDIIPFGGLIPTGIADDALVAIFKQSPDAAKGVGLAINRLTGLADNAVTRVIDEDVLIKASQLHDVPVSELRRILKLPLEYKDEALAAIYKKSQGGHTAILREIFGGRGIDVSETVIKTAMESKQLSKVMVKEIADGFKTALASGQVDKARGLWDLLKKWGTIWLKVEGGALFVTFMFEELLQGLGWAISEAKKNAQWDHASNLNSLYGDVSGWLQFYSDSGAGYLPIVGPIISEWAAGSKEIHDFHSGEIEAKTTGGLPPGTSEIMVGKVREVIDGDTLVVHMNEPDIATFEVRVVGTNTPEIGEPFKKESMDMMFDKVYGRDVTLKTDESNLIDQYGRVLATVNLDGRDIGLEMIKEGMAFFYPYRPHKYVDELVYKQAEEDAKFAKLGIWQGQTGKIKAYSKPTRAAYIIDGVSYGVTGAMSSEIPIGFYNLLLRLPGYDDYIIVEPVEVKAGETTVLPGTYELIGGGEVGPGVPGEEMMTVLIDSMPSNAKLYIDGVYTGHWTPADERELADVKYLLAPGPHTVRATKTGLSAELDVELLAGQNPDIFLVLGQPPQEGEEQTPPGSMGRLEVISQPSNARVLIDGVYTGHITPSVGMELDPLPPGTYQLRIERSGYLYDEPVEIADGGTTRVSVVLGEVVPGTEPEPGVSAGRLQVYSSPANARIWVDGIYVHHLTPAPHGELEPLTPGPHVVMIEKGGYDTVQDTVVITEGQSASWGSPTEPIIMPPYSGTTPGPITPPGPVVGTLEELLASLTEAEKDILKDAYRDGRLELALGLVLAPSLHG